MKFKEFKHEPVKPDTYEASMALNQLLKIGRHAIKIHNMIDDSAEMEAWVAKKIDLAGDYVKKVHGYMQGEKAGLYDDGGLTEDEGEKFVVTYKGIQKANDEDSALDILQDNGYDVERNPDGTFLVSYKGVQKADNIYDVLDILRDEGYDVQIEDDEESSDSWYKYGYEGMTEEKSPQEKLAIMSKIEKIKKQSRDLAGDKDRNLINKNKELLAKLVKQLHEGMGEKIANMAQNMTKDEFMSNADELGLTPEEAAEYYAKMQGGAHAGKFEDAGFDVEAWSTGKVEDHGPDLMRLAKGQPIEITAWDSYYMDMDDGRPDNDEGNVAADDSIGGEVTSAIRGHMDDIQKADFVGDTLKFKPTADTIKYAQNIIKSPEFKKAYNSTESVSEDAGEGHMSKSTLYHTAKYAIELMSMINKGDDLEGWVQSKLNKAADYLQGVHNYEEYQKLNPYREELDPSILQRHAGIVQKNIDEILARETSLDDVDTKPGMMRILAKRVNEVEKEIAKEQRKNNEEAPPGREKQVKALKKKFKDKGAPYAIAWAQHNKHGKPKNEAELEEGLKDWARNLAMAGVVVAGLAGVGSINDAINNSVPAVKAMNTAYEMAVDQGQTELANQIKKDISAVKVRLDSGRDLNFVKDMQDKYSKFMKTEGLAYESKLAIMLDQRIK